MPTLSDVEIKDRYRRVKRMRVVVVVLLLFAGAGLGVLRAMARHHTVSDRTWWRELLGVVLLAVVGLVWTRVRWRCPACLGSFWGRRASPTTCPYCRVQLV